MYSAVTGVDQASYTSALRVKRLNKEPNNWLLGITLDLVLGAGPWRGAANGRLREAHDRARTHRLSTTGHTTQEVPHPPMTRSLSESGKVKKGLERVGARIHT